MFITNTDDSHASSPGSPDVFPSNRQLDLLPHVQVQLDLQSGALHAEDKDYTTTYHYFFEVFENLSGQDGGKSALGALQYMCNVMPNLVCPLSGTDFAKVG